MKNQFRIHYIFVFKLIINKKLTRNMKTLIFINTRYKHEKIKTQKYIIDIKLLDTRNTLNTKYIKKPISNFSLLLNYSIALVFSWSLVIVACALFLALSDIQFDSLASMAPVWLMPRAHTWSQRESSSWLLLQAQVNRKCSCCSVPVKSYYEFSTAHYRVVELPTCTCTAINERG